ncbi:single-stranded DNA-binding protein [Mucilaginibacter kameinonensis]|uniref:single-stranded DNA-binding protein n=1 Tax=Mucilaginibacter kameinonensis TaxID=452286 RepID=UPI000EF7E774|nr:single-stranded DNA-binding protein [Mucilaginibacter kameinonensis]
MEMTGRLTGDAQVSEVKGDKKVVNFNIAINDSYKNRDGERVELVTYVDCAYWINAGVAEYLKKGLLVEMYGRVGARAWIDKEGNARGVVTFNASNIKFLGGAAAKPAGDQEKKTEKQAAGKSSSDDDDLPF